MKILIADDEPLSLQLQKHTSAQFSHGVCPDCYEKILKPQIEQA